jgi:hypothetical protein
MRGKIVVLGMLGSAALLLVYSLWFFSSTPTPSERFNMRRRPLEADVAGPAILRERGGDLLRTSIEIDTMDNIGGVRHGLATYKSFEGKPITFEVLYQPSVKPSIVEFFTVEAFAKRAGSTDERNITMRIHAEAQTPYAYGVYAAATYTYYEFAWVNGDWLLRASTRDAGIDALLLFVNGYVY